MKLNIIFFVVGIFVIELNVTGVTGQITNPPQNAVVEVGGQTILNCTSDTNLQNWLFSTTREVFDNASAQRIVLNCDVQSGFTAHYEVDRPGASDKKCNLIIKAATMQQAGVYTCIDIQTGPSAILTVIARNASITVTKQPETVEGETVAMSYAVQYNTSTASSRTPTIQPVLSWIDSDGNGVTGSANTTANSVTSSISVTAGRQDIRPYTCRISYKIVYPPSSTGLPFADNIPNGLSNPPSTTTINVLYAPKISSIDSKEVPICPGKKVVTLTCVATANPPPTYSWIGPNSISYNGTTIEVEMNGAYTCNATNVIRGSTRSDTKEAILDVVCWFWFLLLLWFLNPISTAIFLVHYKCSRGRSDYNERYPFLTRMLPCMNTSEETPCSKVGWTILFIVMAIFSGIQFLILAIVTCVGCRNGGTRFQKVCFALSLAYMILGIILFAISVGVISYECDRQCNKR